MTTSQVQLSTGWESDTPVDDTFLRRYVTNLAAWFEALAHASGGRTFCSAAWAGALLPQPAGFLDGVTLLQPMVDDAFQTALVEIEAWLGGRAGFLWSAWPIPDSLGPGWELVGHPPLLLRLPGDPLPPVNPSLRVKRVTDAAGVSDWEDVLAHGFPVQELQRNGGAIDAHILEDARASMWVGYEDDRPVTIGTLFAEAGVANFTLGATLPEARRRGYWFTMMRVRLEAAADLLSAALFSDSSRPGAERLGFLPLLRFACWRRCIGRTSHR